MKKTIKISALTVFMVLVAFNTCLIVNKGLPNNNISLATIIGISTANAEETSGPYEWKIEEYYTEEFPVANCIEYYDIFSRDCYGSGFLSCENEHTVLDSRTEC